MKTVSVSQLKAQLSRYLRDVRRGSEIQVLDRGSPVARLVPVGGGQGDEDDRRRRLARSGVLRMGTGRVAKAIRATPLDIGGGVSDALLDGRKDRV